MLGLSLGNHLYDLVLHSPGRYLHVVPEFEVGGELDALRRRDIPIRNKDHVGNGSSWKKGSTYKLADQIDAALLICDCRHYADRNEEDAADGQTQKETVPW